MTPHDYCRQKAAPQGSSLHYATLFLDPPRRQALTALHAFRREIGDIVRDCEDIEPARAKLAWWRMEICAMYEQRADHPVTRALADVMQNFTVVEEQLQEIIDGYEMDLDQGRYPDFKALQLYCYRISSTISVISSGILGYENRQTAKFAHELGLALQLADIVRNVGLDARHGRIYLPLDEMQQFGVDEDTLLASRKERDAESRPSAELAALLHFQAQRFKTLKNHALSLLAETDRRSQRFLLAQAVLEHTVIDEIERDGYRVLDQGLAITPLRKFWLVTTTWLRN